MNTAATLGGRVSAPQALLERIPRIVRRGVFRVLRQAWRALRMQRVLQPVLRHAPHPVARALRRLRLATETWAEHAVVPVDDLADVYRRSLSLLIERNGRAALGDYLEFGVYVGTSLATMHRVSDELGLERLRLIGFDSFQGLPDAARSGEGGVWAPGAFASDEEFTRRNLTRLGVDWSRVVLVPGWFDETLTPETREAHRIRRASVVMIDCDLYASTLPALAFCEPLIDREAVFIFDDWDSAGLADKRLGERRAFDEFLAAHPELTAQEVPAYFPARAFLVSRSA